MNQDAPVEAAPSREIHDVFEALNRPSASKLKVALTKRGIPFTAQEVADVVKSSASRQIYAPRQTYPGKVTSRDTNNRWAIDTIHLVARPSKNGDKYIVVAQDIFSRRVFAKATTNVSPVTVGHVFEEFVAEHGVPLELSSDEGEEFTSRHFKEILHRLGIVHRVKTPQDKNAIATLDRAIGGLKQALVLADALPASPGSSSRCTTRA